MRDEFNLNEHREGAAALGGCVEQGDGGGWASLTLEYTRARASFSQNELL